jgi:hypothetical protein
MADERRDNEEVEFQHVAIEPRVRGRLWRRGTPLDLRQDDAPS